VVTTTIQDVMDPEVGDAILSYRDLAALLYRERRARDAYLPGASKLWSDPGWDMLLDLFIATEDGKQVSVTSACIGACLAPTTGLRWIRQLTDAGLITRTDDPSDGRKGMLGVTAEARAGIRRYLDHAIQTRGLAAPSLPVRTSAHVRNALRERRTRASDAEGPWVRAAISINEH
jgi:hypothetical protein